MAPRDFVQSGRHESVKGLFHVAGAGLCSVMAIYNAVAWRYRRERHLKWNGIIYTLATLWEVRQTARHFCKSHGGSDT